jgi:transcriptional regulator with XRE-family HTH domain
MGRSRRPQPRRLAAKLRAIRLYFDLTQEQMIKRLGDSESPLYQGHISEFELGKREPSSLVMLQYARAANVTMEMLVDDRIDLPGELGTITISIERIKGKKRNPK